MCTESAARARSSTQARSVRSVANSRSQCAMFHVLLNPSSGWSTLNVHTFLSSLLQPPLRYQPPARNACETKLVQLLSSLLYCGLYRSWPLV